jgi:hypothetical protein
MAAESNTPVDIEIWIEKVIRSCETLRHRINAKKLLRLYINRLREEGMPYYQTTYINDKFENMLWEVKEEIKSKQLLKG